jgi:O-acetyl-ADP-ribose deacetylase (regulator of RNase III)
MSDFTLILVDPNPRLCDSFRSAFKPWPEVRVINDYFQNLKEFDCMVSAANSFGLMDGGVDLAIVEFFGQDLQARVQRRILEEFLGEQPVGTSFIIETRHPSHPFLAHTPTMRVPINIEGTDNVYQAMYAMLLGVRRHNQVGAGQTIGSVACPGLGTATGHVAPEAAAAQMSLAYAYFRNPPTQLNWDYATDRHNAIRLNRPFRGTQ